MYPDPPPADVVRCLDLAGLAWRPTAGPVDRDVSWAGAVVVADEDEPDAAIAFARNFRRDDQHAAAVLLLIRGSHLGLLDTNHDVFDDFCVTPFHPLELEARLRHLLVRDTTGEAAGELITSGPLVLNVETYQAQIDGRPLDLTYMEYALLKYLAGHPGRVFTREMLLSHVWGYEYYGGARTVDVHVRRLRAKLGEEHAALIQTVRSVGYRFGESRWER